MADVNKQQMPDVDGRKMKANKRLLVVRLNLLASN